jgi:hypothetical protein
MVCDDEIAGGEVAVGVRHGGGSGRNESVGWYRSDFWGGSAPVCGKAMVPGHEAMEGKRSTTFRATRQLKGNQRQGGEVCA